MQVRSSFFEADRRRLFGIKPQLSYPTEHSVSYFPSSASAMTIYTLGYARWSIDEVAEVLDTLDAVLVDVRQSPYTSKPDFGRKELSARFPDRYFHLAAFGNVNYRGGPIEIADPDKGLHEIEGLDRPFVLMCGCRTPEACHRSVVADLIAEETGGAVQHLRSPSERAQPGLFDNAASNS